MTCPDNCSCYHDRGWTVNIVDCAAAGFAEPPPAIPMDATEVYLAGNSFARLSSHSFIGRKQLRVLYLNGSRIEAILNYTFYGLRRLAELRLEDNAIARLEGHEFSGLSGLRLLRLDRNRIEAVGPGTFDRLDSLEVLRLDHNRLAAIDGGAGAGFSFLGLFSGTGGGGSPYLVEVALAGNPWECSCALAAWLRDHRAKIVDAERVTCRAAANSDEAATRVLIDDNGDIDDADDEYYDNDDDDRDVKSAVK